MKFVNLKIDDKEIQVSKGTTVLEAPSRGCENLRTEGGDGVEPIVASGPGMLIAR